MIIYVVLALSCVVVVLSVNSCNFNVNIKQNLHNDGFHRNLTYGIVFNGQDGEQPWLQDCFVGLDQMLPPGVFANPDELGDLRRAHRLNVVPKSRINVELPTEHSDPSSVYIIGKIIDNKAYLWVPVHARYHQATDGGGTASTVLPAPTLFVRCSDARLALCGAAPPATFLCNGSSKDKCIWTQLPYKLLTSAPEFKVPVGSTKHSFAAAAGTAAALALGTVALMRSLHQYSKKKRQLPAKLHR